MKLISLEISQFMRVEAVSMTFAPSGAIVIGGGNGSGKTSVQTFVEMCFGGKDKCPAMPVKTGAKKALGRLMLDDEGRCVAIDYEIGADRGIKCTVKQDGGPPFPGPITMLRAMVSLYSFDPFSLLKLTGQDQRREMLRCLGVSFADLESRADALKEERKAVGRDRAGRERQIASMPEHIGVPVAEETTKSLTDELQKALAHNKRVQDFADAANDWAHAVADEKQALADAVANIAMLEEKLAAAKTARVAAEHALNETEANHKASVAAASKLKPIDIAPINARIGAIDATNAKVRANKARAALVVQYQSDHDRFVELGEQLLTIEREKQERLNAAKCPVPGLEFRDEGVYYQGLPLSQDMESDQMIRAVQLAAALNPKLRAVFIDNAERLGAEKMAELDAWAEANEYQVFCFRQVADAEGCEFFLTEGKIQ